MTTKDGGPTENHFVTRRLPWVTGIAGLVIYLVSLNHWVSLQSLGTVARLSGWLWQPELGRPLTLAFFAPLKLLPASWLPWLANFISAVCAALVLQQLARSVAILRQDVAPDGPPRKNQTGLAILTGPLAWLPPVFAVLVCGFQLGFWEHATAASGEMLSLLCFAVAVRCVLEFRWEPEQKWLSRAALVYALGMTDNWLLLGYLPVFIAGVIWVKGFSPFLEFRFLARMFGWALLGLSLYLLLPTVLIVSAPDDWTFGAALKTGWASQRNALLTLRSPALRLFALTGVLPFLLLAVRWRSHSVQLADDTHQGIFVTKASGHFIHALFFLTSLWIAFNPAFVPHTLEAGSSLLIYYYSWALVAGYGLGYLLLFAAPQGSRRPGKWPVYAAALLVVVIPVTLFRANFPTVRLTNSSALHQFARQMHEDLPGNNVAVLSDDSLPLLLLQAELRAHETVPSPMLVNTRLLPALEYHARKHAQHDVRWPDMSGLTNKLLTATEVLQFVARLATNMTLVYLHPSSGFFFEEYSSVPHGWAQILKRRPPDNSNPAFSTDSARAIWQNRAAALDSLARQFSLDRNRAEQQSPLRESLHLARRTNEVSAVLAPAYSKVLNHWGVTERRAGQTNAEIWFERALAFDPDNLTARINLEFARREQTGDSTRITPAWLKTNWPALFARVENWPDVISRSGPVDEPTFLLKTGRMYLAARNPHQAQENFTRAAELAPQWLAPRIWLAQCQLFRGNFIAARQITDEISRNTSQLKGPGLAQLLQVRTFALRGLNQTNEAAAYLEQFAAEHQNENEVLAVAADLCPVFGQFEAGLKWCQLLLQRNPENVEMIVKKGHAELRLERLESAQKTLTAALTLSPTHTEARLLRAIAALRAGKLDAARRDYQELLKTPEREQSALFGLGGIAWREQDTNALIKYYEAFLSNSPSAAPQTGLATQRLKDWTED